MSGRATPATALLDNAGAAYVLHSYTHDPRASAYGVEAAKALGIDPSRMFKTLVATVDGRLAVGLVPVSGTLDLRALAAALHGKRGLLADPVEAARATGYVVGGISPLGQRRRLPTVVDSSAMSHVTILVSAGRRGLQVELAPTDLVQLSAARVAVIASS